jgi:hypothetical protein
MLAFGGGFLSLVASAARSPFGGRLISPFSTALSKKPESITFMIWIDSIQNHRDLAP